MTKTLIIAAQEYRRNVFKRSFLLVLLSVPAFIIFSVGIGILIDSLEDNNDPVGYVDQAGVFAASGESSELRETLIADEVSIEFIPFEEAAEAQTALEQGSIQGFFILAESYPQTYKTELVFIEQPGSNVIQEFETLIRVHLLAGEDSEVTFRAITGTDVTVQSQDGRRVIPGSGAPMGTLIPLFICIAFLFLIMMSSGYMMGAIAEEKENRTIEMLTTSVSASRLITGKIIGTVGIGLTIFLTWILVIVLGMLVASQFGVDWFENMFIDWRVIIATTAVAIPAFILVAALMTAIGAMVTTTQEGQSISAVFFILHFAPFYIAWIFATDPHSPLAVAFSLMPFTALLSIGLRNLFTIVPAWQVYASVVIQVTLAVAAIWFAARAFRMGMLQYGQRLPWRRLMQSTR